MKVCPICNRSYADESLIFCLDDGATLGVPHDANQTLRLPNPRDTDSSRTRPPQQSTILAVQPNLYAQKPQPQTEEKKATKSGLVIAIALACIGLVAAAFLAGLFWSKRDSSKVTQPNSNVVSNVNKPTPTPEASIENDDGWAPRHDQASINEGKRLTYYPGSTPEQCQSDCDDNSECRAYTYIRPGAYNATDPPMCYLLSEAKEFTPSTCCISAMKSRVKEP